MPSCRTCNANNSTTSKYCSACGAALEDSPPKPYVYDSANASTTDNAPPVSPGDTQVLELLRAGKKIPAIKLYREKVGGGLKEAKDYVEALGLRHGIVPAKGAGCAGMLILMCATLLAATAVFIQSV
jgi:hypothetical protein